ncbi:MAG: hypothetical protein RJA81_975 [Planctomycetota bacterium]|jgi:hypothetical protein
MSDDLTGSIQQQENQIPVWRQFWDQAPEPEAIRDWTRGLTPGLIGAALWIPWLDGLTKNSLPFGGVRSTFLGMLAGSFACLPVFYLLTFLVRYKNRPFRQVIPNLLGNRAGSLIVLFTHGLLAFAILTVAIDQGSQWYFQTLTYLKYMSEPPTTFLRYLTTATWALWVIPIGYGMVRIIAALLDYVPILIAAVLSLLFITALLHLQEGLPSLVFPSPNLENHQLAFGNAFRWTFLFGTIISIFAADWGLGLKRNRDVVLGGLIGLSLSLIVVGSIGIFTIAAFGAPNAPVPSIFEILSQNGHGITLACGLLIGTYVTAPGVFASYHVLQDLRQVFPRVHHWVWLILKIMAVQAGIALIHNGLNF